MGPLSLNLSRSGVSLSAGLRGARVTVGPRGTYVSLGAGGFQYRKKLSDSGQTPRAPPAALTPAHPGAHPTPGQWQMRPAPGQGGAILTASVDSLQAMSPDAIAVEIQACASRSNLFKGYCIGSAVFLFLVVVTAGGWAALVLAIVLAAAGAWVYRWNEDRRVVRLFYDVDDPGAMERLAHACAVGEALSQCAALWHIHQAYATNDQKRNAGASTLVARTIVRSSQTEFPNVETNVGAYSIAVGPQKLLFLPDRLIVREGDRVAAVPYEHLSATAAAARFVEEGHVPPDAQVMDTTWRYVNKSGGPDRRFNNNAQLPVMRYGDLSFNSPHGIRILFQTSLVDCAMRAAHALNQLAAIARNNRMVTPAPGTVAQSGAPGWQ